MKPGIFQTLAKKMQYRFTPELQHATAYFNIILQSEFGEDPKVTPENDDVFEKLLYQLALDRNLPVYEMFLIGHHSIYPTNWQTWRTIFNGKLEPFFKEYQTIQENTMKKSQLKKLIEAVASELDKKDVCKKCNGSGKQPDAPGIGCRYCGGSGKPVYQPIRKKKSVNEIFGWSAEEKARKVANKIWGADVGIQFVRDRYGHLLFAIDRGMGRAKKGWLRRDDKGAWSYKMADEDVWQDANVTENSLGYSHASISPQAPGKLDRDPLNDPIMMKEYSDPDKRLEAIRNREMDALKLIYMWVKQDTINYKEFQRLVSEFCEIRKTWFK